MRVIFVTIVTLTGLCLLLIGVAGLGKSGVSEGPTADKTYALLAQASHFSSFVLGLLLIAVGNATEKLSSIVATQQKSVARLEMIVKLLQVQGTVPGRDVAQMSESR